MAAPAAHARACVLMDSHCDNPSFSGAASDATREVPDRMRDKPGPRRENILVAVSGAAIKSAIDFTDAVAISQLLFLSPIFEEERSRYVDIGMKHVLVGSAAAKFVGGCLSGYDVIAHTATYEALPFLQRVVAAAAIEHAESHANRDGSSSNERENADPVAATAIVAACLVSVISGFFMAFVAKYTPQVVKLLKMLPYSVKVGIEAVIGWNVLALAFELPTGVNWTTFGSPMEVADFCTQHTLKIVTVVCLAVCLRKIEDIWDSSMSLIVFFVGSSAAIHGVFSLVAMNSSQAQDQGERNAQFCACREVPWLCVTAAEAFIVRLVFVAAWSQDGCSLLWNNPCHFGSYIPSCLRTFMRFSGVLSQATSTQSLWRPWLDLF